MAPRSAFSLNPFCRSTQPHASHPLRLLEPKFKKSWDSFFHDNTEKQQKSSGPSALAHSVSKSVRLLNLRKKHAGEENSELNLLEDQPKSGWFKSLFTKNTEPPSPAPGKFVVEFPASCPSHPQLMILTERAASLKPNDLLKIEVSPTQDEPGLAWSMSPTPLSIPWIKSFPPRKAPPMTFPPLPPPASHPGKCKNANVPTDVGSTPPDHDPSPLAMPLHNRFEQHPPSAMQSLVNLALYPKFTQLHSLLAPPKEQF